MKLRILEAGLMVGLVVYLFIFESLFPMPLDFFAIIAYSCTWLFKTGTRGIVAARCFYFGVWFAYVLGAGMSPSEQQIETLKKYELYNLRFQEVVGGSISDEHPKNYLHAVRLIVACDFNDFKSTPPKPIQLEVEL
tara:strand:+ start:30483 stop:30890 length:408 start_codon:yes stop_codon:yes gene_type:complete